MTQSTHDNELLPEPASCFDAGNVATAPGILVDANQDAVQRIQALWAIVNHQYLPGLAALLTLARDSSTPADLRHITIGALSDFHTDSVLQTLVELLDQGAATAGYRLAAIHSLDNLGDRRAVPPLLDLLRHKDNRTRAASADALGSLGDIVAVPPLIRLLLDRREPVDVRKKAAESLGQLSDQQALDPLVQVLLDERDSAQVRSSAARGLGSLGNVSAAGPLLRLLPMRPAHKKLLGCCIDALGALGDKQAVLPLTEALLDTNLERALRCDAAAALERLADIRALDALVSAAASPDARLRYYAVSAIAGIADPLTVDPLLAFLADEDWEIVWTAVEALGKIGDVRAIEPLSALLDKSGLDTLVHGSIFESLAQLRYGPAFQLISGTLADTTLSDSLRGGAAQGLAYIAGDEAYHLLVQLLDDAAEWVQYKAVHALAGRGDSRAVEPLLLLARRIPDSDGFMTDAIQHAIAKLDPTVH